MPQMISTFEDKTAYVLCTLAYIESPDHEPVLFRGKCEGSILEKPKGPRNFGFDPIFKPKNQDLSYAEMGPEIKNAISHRSLAMNAFHQFLQSKSQTA